MSPSRARLDAQPAAARSVARLALAIGTRIRDERTNRRWTVRALAERAHLSAAAVYAVELGRPASVDTYVRLCDALGLALQMELLDRRRAARPSTNADAVHAAMGELEVRRLSELGFKIGVDEPYQHYQFAGRADVVAWDVTARSLLHIENRTRYPNIQEAAGAWNAKRTYLPAALATRLGVRGGWTSVTHVMAALWSAEVLHVMRLREVTFQALCPDPIDAFAEWWSGTPPKRGVTTTMVVLDPAAAGRQRQYCSMADALRAKPRYRGYRDAADRLQIDGR
jgi:transcriptional regulator with XRE-family HTH domain